MGFYNPPAASLPLTGGTLTGPLTAVAGTTSVAPIKFQSGVNLSSPTAGATEYDGNVLYFTPNTSNRNLVLSEAMQLLTAGSTYTLTSQQAAQKLFNVTANGAITLPAGTFYFECFFSLSSMSGTSGSFGFALGGGATFTQSWLSTANKATLATQTAWENTYNTAANTAICANTTGTVGAAFISGIINVTVGGTIIPQVSLGVAAAAVVGANSYCRFTPLGAANVGSIGNWS